MNTLDDVKILHRKFCLAMSDFNVARKQLQKRVQKTLDEETEEFCKERGIKLDKYDLFIANFDGGCMTSQWEPSAFISRISMMVDGEFCSYQANMNGQWSLTTNDKNYNFKTKRVKQGPCLVSDLELFCGKMTELLGIKVFIYYDDTAPNQMRQIDDEPDEI